MLYLLKILRLIAYFSIIICCSNCKGPSQELNSKNQGRTIEMSHFKEVQFLEKTLRIGSSRYAYFRGEHAKLIVTNLPKNRDFIIKVNGQEKGSYESNGDWECELKVNSSGIKRNNIEIFDLEQNKVLKETINYEVRELNPFIGSEMGDYLIKGIPTELRISSLGVSCPSIKLRAEGADVHFTNMGSYNVIPYLDSEKVTIIMKFNGHEFLKELDVIDTPPPHMEFVIQDNIKCIYLRPIGLYPDLTYNVIQINGYSALNDKEVKTDNSNCYPLSKQFFVREVVYSIEGTKILDTLKLN